MHLLKYKDYYYMIKIKNMLNIVKFNFLIFDQFFYKKS